MREITGVLLLAVVAGCSDSSSSRHHAASAAASTSSSPGTTTSGTTAPTTSAPAPVASAPANLQTGPGLVIDSASGKFFDLPWPFDVRRTATGGPDTTGLPNPRGEAFIDQTYRVCSEADGFSPTGHIYLLFDGPINSPTDDPLASTRAPYPVLLVDIDPNSPDRLTRHPFNVAVKQRADSIRPANLLQMLPIPGRGLRFKTTYAAIVLRSLGGPNTAWLGQSPTLTTLLAGREPVIPKGAEMAKAFGPLPAALRDLGIHPQDVAAATVFTTGDPTAKLVRQVAHVSTLPGLPLSEPFVIRDRFADFTALKAAFRVPQYQDGYTPFLFQGGRQVVDAQGRPVQQSVARSEFQVSVPKGAMPAGGFPLYLYCHGTGGLPGQAIDRGRWTTATTPPPPGSGQASYMGRAGWATACMAGPFSPARLGFLAADGYLAYNFLNPVAMRDNFLQMVLEQIHFLKTLLSLRIDASLCPGTDASASPDGKVGFDPAKVVIGGQSLGSYLAGMLAATSDAFQGAILTGAGGSWVEFAFGPKVPFDLHLVVDLLSLPLGETLDRFHPLIMAFDLGVGPADNTQYHRFILREPLPGHTPPHVLVIEGDKDLQVATALQRALVLGIGLDFVGSDPGPTPADQILPVLPIAGLNQLSYPVGGNRTLANGQRRTAVVVRYREDGIQEGHMVVFQLDAPKRQITDFLGAIKGGTVPTVRQ